MKSCKILINLDCIFDTLLGTVTLINPEWVTPLFKNGYLKRVHNTLSLINPEINDSVIMDRYANRDMDVLRLSGRTNVVNIVADYLLQSATSDKEHPLDYEYNLIINTYPYELSIAELKELFTCFKLLFVCKSISRIHLPVSELTPQYIKEKCDRLIIYDFNEWIGYQRDKLKDCKIPDKTCVIPLCYVPGKEHSGNTDEAMKWIKAGFSSYLDIDFLSLADMSLCLPKDYGNN